MFRPVDLFDFGQSAHAAPLFDGCEFAWQALLRIPEYLSKHLTRGLHNRCDGVAYIGPAVFIGPGTVVEDGAMIRGPAMIGSDCQIRHNAYIRENVIIGDRCVVGNSCELKNSVLFNEVAAPHFNYVGDSILGWKVHLGAGVKISNVKVPSGTIYVHAGLTVYDTGLRKFGAIIGDSAEIGCNAVLNPGSIIGRGSIVYPNTNWRGVLPPGHIAKNRAEIEVVQRK